MVLKVIYFEFRGGNEEKGGRAGCHYSGVKKPKEFVGRGNKKFGVQDAGQYVIQCYHLLAFICLFAHFLLILFSLMPHQFFLHFIDAQDAINCYERERETRVAAEKLQASLSEELEKANQEKTAANQQVCFSTDI